MMYDLIIVGGGVAGLHFASRVKDKKVLLIEEHKKLGPRRCSGIVSRRINAFFDLPKNLVERKVEKAVISCGEVCAKINLKSVVLDKDGFERWLLKKAEGNAEVVYGRVSSIKDDKSEVRVYTNDSEYTTKYIVGCDGANSIVRKTFVNKNPKKFYFGKFCYSWEKSPAKYQIFFDSKYSDLFSWISPRKGKAEYGLICGKNLNEYYSKFISEKKPENILEEGFGVIPVGLCQCSFSKGILIGNSAGMTKPLTGGGVIYSLIASELALKEFEKEKPNFKNYEKEVRKKLAKEIDRQMLVRKIYSGLSDERKKKFLKVLGRSNLELDMDFPISDILNNKKLRVLSNLIR